ncbi:uncharacterized protein LOC141631928 [Silene latifolia]|uniref:uncharacterized protein LOC141631928 n=1 Tax=Silene latifolia TaxID=37657 RepID=UPI003D772449
MSLMGLKDVVEKMGIHMIRKGDAISDQTMEPELYDQIRKKYLLDSKIQEWKEGVEKGTTSIFLIHADGRVWFNDRWCVPKDDELKKIIMTKAHCTLYSVYPGSDKLYKYLKKTFWWPGMKKEVADFVARCLTCQRVKGEQRWLQATDGKTERTIKTLEDMPRACVMEFGGTWEDRLDLIEFFYNGSYHTSIGITPFEALYGRKCRSPVCWDNSSEAVVLGPQMVGDKVRLRVSPMRGVMRFGKRGKLSQKFIGPYEILDRICEAAYRLEVEIIELDEVLTYVEVPKEILDRKVRKTRNGVTTLLKVLWSNHNVEEAKWEPEEAMKERYPHLFEQVNGDGGCES